MRIAQARPEDLDALGPLLLALWPGHSLENLSVPLAERIFAPEPAGTVLIAWSDEAEAVGFAEAMLRTDYVNGCETSPVGFVEGIYVKREWRRRGVARALVDGVETWARTRGVQELASDALIDNVASHGFHAAIGFDETERVVYFRRPIEEPQP